MPKNANLHTYILIYSLQWANHRKQELPQWKHLKKKIKYKSNVLTFLLLHNVNVSFFWEFNDSFFIIFITNIAHQFLIIANIFCQFYYDILFNFYIYLYIHMFENLSAILKSFKNSVQNWNSRLTEPLYWWQISKKHWASNSGHINTQYSRLK